MSAEASTKKKLKALVIEDSEIDAVRALGGGATADAHIEQAGGRRDGCGEHLGGHAGLQLHGAAAAQFGEVCF